MMNILLRTKNGSEIFSHAICFSGASLENPWKLCMTVTFDGHIMLVYEKMFCNFFFMTIASQVLSTLFEFLS